MLKDLIKTTFFFYSVICCSVGGYYIGKLIGGAPVAALLAICSLGGIYFIIQEYHKIADRHDEYTNNHAKRKGSWSY